MLPKIHALTFLALTAVCASQVHATPSTDLSRKARLLKNGMSPADVRNLLGSPNNVIAPQNLKANDIAPSPDIKFVLTWDNPACSRVEVMFGQTNRVTGWDGGELCMAQKALPASYACSKPGNAKYCAK